MSFLTFSLVRPAFWWVGIISTVVIVAIFLIIFSLFGNYMLSLETALTGVNPHIVIHFDSQATEKTHSWLTKIRASAKVEKAQPALYLTQETKMSKAGQEDCLCCQGRTLSIYDMGDCSPAKVIDIFHLNKTVQQTLLLKGISVDSAGKTVLDLDSFSDNTDHRLLTIDKDSNGNITYPNFMVIYFFLKTLHHFMFLSL